MIKQKYLDFRITFEVDDSLPATDKTTKRLELTTDDQFYSYLHYYAKGLLSFELIKLAEGNFIDLNQAGGNVSLAKPIEPTLFDSGDTSNGK